MPLLDKYGRNLEYLRISITDKCNLNCCYCSSPFAAKADLPREEILSLEEISRAAQAAVVAGVRKIRITGGEPLLRRGVIELCSEISKIPGLQDLAITTNGIFLPEYAKPLFDAGVKRINVSLDTLRPARFKKITGANRLPDVLRGLEGAHEAGFDPIKINTVVMRGINDLEIPWLAGLTYNQPFHVRFIELMPLKGADCSRFKKAFLPCEEIMKRIPGIQKASPCENSAASGPSRDFRLPNALGKVGFISPLSRHFCETCNRLRLTAEGKIATCVFSKGQIDVKSSLRSGAGIMELAGNFKTAAMLKPIGHEISNGLIKEGPTAMSAIGG